MAESIPLSRTTSRNSRHGSARSRSLIKKNIEVQDLNAADLLIERFTAWKIIVKQLASYFEGIADIENNTAREMTKIAGIIQVPFRSGNQFLGEGGLQDVFYGIRDKTRQISDQHADLGRTVDSSIVQHLQKLLVEIKAHLKNVQNDTAKLASSVAKERETSTKLIGELANDISLFRNTPMHITAKSDPYLANQAVSQQLQKQVLEENLLQKSIVVMQQNSAHFETGIIRAIQSAWQSFDEWQSRASSANQEIYRSLSAHMASIAPDQEWISFAARSDHLLDPETPLRDPALVNYPCKDDPSVFPVHSGYIERKKRVSRSYEESYFVLTPAGFLHGFSNSDPSHPSGHGLNPVFSLFLPNCTLGPPSSPSSKSHKFHIEGRKDGTGTTKSGGGLRHFLGGDNTMAWSFRARSREEMMEWWNDIRMLCARYLIASESIERSGPVEAAVRSAGYEDEGSSEEEEEGAEEAYREGESRPPGYVFEKSGYGGTEMGPHGYIKKGDPAYDTHGIHAHPSTRQQEKAPEGQRPRSFYENGTSHVGQDTLAPQITGASGVTSPRLVHATGYIPDDMEFESAHPSAHHDSHAHDPGHLAPQHSHGQGGRTLSPPPPPGLGYTRSESPRVPPGGYNDSPHNHSHGRLSPYHRPPSPQPPHHGGRGSLSPREGASSPAYATGTTAPQYAAADTAEVGRDEDDGPVGHNPGHEAADPVTTSYTGGTAED